MLMKKRKLSILISLTSIPLIFALSSCVKIDPHEKTKVSNITFNESALVLNIGESHLLKPTILPSFAKIGRELTYTSLDSNIASITNEGALEAKNAGKTQIIVSNNYAKKDVIDVIVKDQNNPIESTGISLSRNVYTVVLGSFIDVEYKILPSDANTFLDATFKIDDETIATSLNSRIFGLKLGETSLNVSLENGVHTNATIRVVEAPEVAGFSISPIASDNIRHVAKNKDEAASIINKAILEHRKSVHVYFDFDSLLTISDFDYSYIDCDMWARIYGSECIANLDKEITINYATDEKCASTSTEIIEEYEEIPNASTTLRLNALNNSIYKRDNSFNNYKIDKFNEGEIAVHNTEELYSCLQRGYRPIFDRDSTRAEYYFNKAKAILNTIVNDEMSNLIKSKAIFDWLVENTNYNYDSLIPYLATSDVASYVEGVFDENSAVCNGFAKVYCIMCAIEGIPCFRGCGYDGGEGHAWNYCYNDETNKWYLVCPTWGQRDIKMIDDGFFNKNYTFTAYNAFMSKKNFFKDVSNPTFEPNVDAFETITGNIMTYFPNLLSYEKLTDKPQYDFQIDSQDELNYVVKKCVEAMKVNQYIIEVQIGKLGNLYTNNFIEALKKAGINSNRAAFRYNTLYTTYYYLMINI